MIPYRIGIGYDIHRLEENRDLIIGGGKIPYEKGLFGHSDADVLIHAIIDALLGAAGLPDIGTIFPDTDEAFKGADSTVLLAKVCEMLSQKGYKIGNIDSNIIAQAPKMMPYIKDMKQRLSEVMKIPAENISVKAKTNEKMDAVGEKLAIEANAAAIIYKE